MTRFQISTDENRKTRPPHSWTYSSNFVCLPPCRDRVSRRQGKLNFVSVVSRMLVFVAATAAVWVHAGEQNMALEYRSNSIAPYELSAGQTAVFWQNFKIAFDQHADEVFTDQFHPFKVMNRDMESADTDSSKFRERSSHAAWNSLSKSLVGSIRDAAVHLSAMSWIEERQGWLANFLWNSVDSVQEEAVAPLDPSYHPIEQSWWEALSEKRQVRYGVRPLQKDPYAFLSFGIKDGDRIFLLGHVRYHYSDFSDHRFELAFSVPVTRSVSVNVGTLYQFGMHAEEKKITVKIFKEFKSGGILHVGFEAQQHPTLLAGVAVPW